MLKDSIRTGFFLAYKNILRSGWWTTGLIIAVMVLTFLNIVVISGILVGLIDGAVSAFKGRLTGDVYISNLSEKTYITNSPFVTSLLENIPEIESFTGRYVESGAVEANYKERIRIEDLRESANGRVSGIDPVTEDEITNLSDYVIRGDYLYPTDFDQVLIGALMLQEFLQIDSNEFRVIDADVGDRILVTVGDVQREVTIKGIIKTKLDEIDRSVIFVDDQFRQMIGRNDFNVDEIAIKLKPGESPERLKEILINAGVTQFARVQTFEDAQPKFLDDIKTTFAILGNVISSIGLVVASITVFIVIFINALTRRKFIGILKGIGINGKAIEWSYVFQSMFYALVGSILGLVIVYFILVPYIANNPINFPFSDGILVASVPSTMTKLFILVGITVVAGYIPARMIIRKNTLDSILGRN